MRFRLLRLLPFAAVLAAPLPAIDKNGVAPQAISLPSGPGSIQGLGESFQPQLNNGSGSTGLKLTLPRGPGGLVPALSLAYNSGGGNGSLGLGWALSGMLSVRRSTDRGVPYYVDGPDGADSDGDGRVDNPEELDTFTGASGEELVTLADGTFRSENESAFLEYRRSGAGWQARSKDGRQYFFGLTAQARIEDSGRVFEWCLERVVDPNGNAIDHEYIADPATPAQKYLHRLSWGSAQAYLSVILSYAEGRPDVFSSFRSGFELKTSLRLSVIDVISQGLPASPAALRADLDGDGKGDALIRRYRFEYEPNVHLSLLARVTQLGHDGVTALPALTYTYTPWTPPDNVTAQVIRSRDAPAAGFESPSVELIDMNGDGLPDLLSTAGSTHRASMNLGVDAEGRLRWAPSRPVDDAPTIDIASDKTHLADATADGLSDLMVKVSNTSFLCFDNTSQNAWVRDPIPIRNTDTWPIWPYDGAGGSRSRSFDSDYSRTNDVLHTGENDYQLWLLLPTGQYSRELRLPRLEISGQGFRFDLPGTHIADLNGDRLQDLAWIQSGRVVYFPNRGRGSFAQPVFLELGRGLSPAEIERSDFSDVDGDGLVDLTLVRPDSQPNDVVYWLNRFRNDLEDPRQVLDGPRTLTGLPARRSGDALRWADMNGNGTTDIVISQAQSAAGERIVFVDLVPEGKTHLLRSADNGLGRRIYMDYESSTAQMVRAAAAGQPWATVMPIAVTVVGRIREDDGLSPPYEQTLTYRDPYYDPAKQEFRGFAQAEASELGDASAATKVMRHTFDTGRQEPCLKGKQLVEEVLGEDGKLFSRSTSAWRRRDLARGVDGRSVCFAFTEAMDRFVHEGEPAGVRLRTESEYDDFGNVTLERRLGVFETPGDEIITERAYDIRLEQWRLDLVSRETIRDASGKRFAETRYFYDALGNQERVEHWLESEDRFIAGLRQRFDAFGNVIEKTDARNSRRSIAYDTLLNAWPTRETVHLGESDLVMTAEYDLGLGVVSRSVSFSGEESEFLHDPLGRLAEKRGPGGALEVYQYQLGAPVSRVTKRAREDDSGSTLEAHAFSDGRGREVLTKLEAEGGKWRVLGAKAYNSRNMEARSWLPYFSATDTYEAPDPGLPQTAKTYDAVGRLIETLAPDGGRTRTQYLQLESLELDGEDTAGRGSPKRLRSDGLERLVEVEEQNGAESYLTRYTWNAREELESITDALGNVKRFRFDSLSRLVEVDDPNRGLLRSRFDDAGNVLETTDARGQVIAFTYDAANRLLTKVYSGAGAGGADLVETAWYHDAPAGAVDFGDGTSGTARNTTGRIAWVEDRSGDTHFSYDERGNIEWVLKRVRDPGTGLLVPFRTQRVYDLLNREVAVVFPDNDLLRFDFGNGAFINSIRGDGPESQVILAAADYMPGGRPLRLLWGNGSESRFEYDTSDRLRTWRLQAPDGALLKHEQITYDLTSSITAIDDLRPFAALPEASPRRTTARFTYDDLHRLTRASYGAGGALGVITYTHDALGNLLEQSTPAAGEIGHIADPAVRLGAVSYAGGRQGRQGRRPGDLPGPHALTSTASGRRLEYDPNGNVTRHDGAVLTWDREDRLERFSKPDSTADYVHDYSGRRVIRRVRRGAAEETAWHIDAAAEVRQDGTLVKYAFIDKRRVARIQGALDPGRETVQALRLRSGWNLVASALATTSSLRGVFGPDAAVYVSTGASTYAPLDLGLTVPPGRAIWVHAPAARLAVLRGVPRAAPAVPEWPGELQAWPRLEGFRPAVDLEGSPALLVFDAATRQWLRRDGALPSFLSDAPAELGAAQAFWTAAPVRFRAAAANAGALVFYHHDAVGSVCALTDSDGRFIEERAHYPFGGLRSRHQPGVAPSGTDHDFTGHERDRESGLVHMGARSYADFAGVFLSPDPRFVAVAGLGGAGGGGGEENGDVQSFTAFLSNPQMGNLYAHALRNPLKYIDPQGLEVAASHALQNDADFKPGWNAFKSTQIGQQLIAKIERQGGKIYFEPGKLPYEGKNYFGGPLGKTSQLDFNAESRMGSIKIDMARHRERAYLSGPGGTTNNIARDIHNQLRLASRMINVQRLTEDVASKIKTLSALPLNATERRAALLNDLEVSLNVLKEQQQYVKNPDSDPMKAEFENELNAPVKVK